MTIDEGRLLVRDPERTPSLRYAEPETPPDRDRRRISERNMDDLRDRLRRGR